MQIKRSIFVLLLHDNRGISEYFHAVTVKKTQTQGLALFDSLSHAVQYTKPRSGAGYLWDINALCSKVISVRLFALEADPLGIY